MLACFRAGLDKALHGNLFKRIHPDTQLTAIIIQKIPLTKKFTQQQYNSSSKDRIHLLCTNLIAFTARQSKRFRQDFLKKLKNVYSYKVSSSEP